MPEWTDLSPMASMSRPRSVVRPVRRRRRGRAMSAAVVMLLLVAIAMGIGAYGTGYEFVPAPLTAPAAVDLPSDPQALARVANRLERRQKQLGATLDRRAPRGVYIVIDQTQNQLFLKKDLDVLRQAKCSAGSGMILKNPKGGMWVFDTPRGAFHVLSRMEDPVWKKPDWAFVEEGKPLPRDDRERFESGALGEYALYFGNGYLIHGTLYERYLQRSVTHGCIRLGREDLREVFHAAPVGTPIYIY